MISFKCAFHCFSVSFVKLILTGHLPHCTNTLNGILVCASICVNDIYTGSGAAASPDLQQGSPSIFVLESLSS